MLRAETILQWKHLVVAEVLGDFRCNASESSLQRFFYQRNDVLADHIEILIDYSIDSIAWNLYDTKTLV